MSARAQSGPATNASDSESSKNTKPLYSYPCRLSLKHTQPPIKYRQLITAVTELGLASLTLIKLTDFNKQKIIERQNNNRQNKLRAKIKQSSQKAVTKKEKSYPGNIVATLISPQTLRSAVFNVGYSPHALSASTILNGGAICHLVNTLNLIVPGTFVANTDRDTVKAGSQILLVASVA